MRVDPSTNLQRVLRAFPASREHLQRLGIDVASDEPLYRACEKAGISLADLQTAMDSIDWTRAEDDSSGVDASEDAP